MTIARLSRRLSETVGESFTTASLGAVSGVVGDVAQRALEPAALLATQPAGKAGAVTPSKFSVQVPGTGVGLGVAVGVGAGVGVGVATGVGDGVGVGGQGGGASLFGVSRSYTSTMPIPVPPFSPERSAV